jgi:hypothetical protein
MTHYINKIIGSTQEVLQFYLANLESGTGLKYRSVLAHELPSPRFQFLVKMADCDLWHSVESGLGGGDGSRGVEGI